MEKIKLNTKKRKPFQLITKHEAMLMNRIGTFLLNHPKSKTKDIIDYFAEYKPEVIRSCLQKLVDSGHVKLIDLTKDK